MVVEYGVYTSSTKIILTVLIFLKFLISVEMVVEYGVINFFNQNNSHIFNFPQFLILLRWS